MDDTEALSWNATQGKAGTRSDSSNTRVLFAPVLGRPRPQCRRSDFPARTVGLVSLVSLVMAGLFGATTSHAGASALSDKRRQARKVANDIESTGNRIEMLQEEYLSAKLKLEKLQVRLTKLQGNSVVTEDRLVKVRIQLRDRVLRDMIRPSDDLALKSSESLGELERRGAFEQLTTGQASDLEDRLRAASADLLRDAEAIEKARKSAAAATQSLAKQKRTADALLNKLEVLQTKTKGELSTLIVEAQREAAAAEARAARAAIVKRQKVAKAELAKRQKKLRDRLARGTSAGANGTGRGDIAGEPASPTRATPRADRNARLLPVEDQSDAQLSVDAGVEASVPSSPGAATAVRVALAQLGKPYVWGASGPNSFDCSGLMLVAWRAGGKSLPHSSRAQFAATRRVSVGQIRPGDMVFFGSPIHHVGMYIGNGNMVEASRKGVPVRVRSIYRKDMVGVGRLG
jgi:peptidoglycan DL-endopeptidase CwlO